MPSLPPKHSVFNRETTPRRNAHQRGYTRRWRKARAAFIAQSFANGDITCKLCGRPLMDNSDIEIDHIIPHRGDPRFFWDLSNWEMAHGACHAAKTRRGE